jgi:UDP-N-acetylmuramoylalanine--D-glutamate ligase
MILPLTHYNGSTVAVFGLGVSGKSVVRALSAGGAKVVAWDGSEETIKQLQAEQLANVLYQDLESSDWSNIDCLVLSAGVPLTHPQPHPVAIKAKDAGCAIICDIELLYHQCPEATYIGITGTNGKSTTTALIGHILRHNGLSVEVGGNIGLPGPSLRALGKGEVYVIEMSSYQLDLVDALRFDISILLNITPDHLDRHGGMDGYRCAKMHIFDRQRAEDAAIIGVDNVNSRRCFDELKGRQGHPELVPISTKGLEGNGVFVSQGQIHVDDQVYDLGSLPKLPGEHNAENIAAAIAVARKLGVDIEKVIKAIQCFDGLEHRIQWVDKKNNITFINDSKATNAEAAAKALGAYEESYWIVGGKQKEGGIDSLKGLFGRVKKAYLIGESEDAFAATLDSVSIPYERCGHLEAAVSKAWDDAKAQDNDTTILFSPACASFDQWPNFEKRGEAFCQYVKQLRS